MPRVSQHPKADSFNFRIDPALKAAFTQATEAEDKPADADKAGDAAAGSQKKLVVRQVFVTSGRRSGGQVEIEKGLKDGDIVVTAGQNRLSNGSPVRIDNSVNPADKSKAVQ